MLQAHNMLQALTQVPAMQRLTPLASLFPRSRVTPILIRTFSSRLQDEEKYHLARALSKTNIDYNLQTKWTNMAKTWDHRWDILPLQKERFSAPYEMEALEKIHKRSYETNVLLEIRDVRLPASTHHPSFTRLAKHRLHLICYTHADMIDATTRDRVRDWTRRSWPKSDCFFADTRESRADTADSFEALYQWILGSLDQKGGIRTALTVGVANTGKSSVLLNLLKYARQHGLIPKLFKARVNLKKKNLRKASGVGIHDAPGKTRELTDYLLCEKPRTYFLDVPGMTPPDFLFEERPEAWYGFGAANLFSLPEEMKTDAQCQALLCEYVLYAMNRDRLFQYVEKLNLKEPTNDIELALSNLGGKFKDKMDQDRLVLTQCKTFLKFFNTGNFGPVILDDIRRPYSPFVFQDSHFRRKKGKRDNDDYDSDEGDNRFERNNEGGGDDDDDDGWDYRKQRGKKERRDVADDDEFSFKAK